MSGLLLYCIAPAGHAPPALLEGVAGAYVSAIGVAGLSAWVSRADHAPAVDILAVRAHHAVVEASITTEITTLPVRFGQWLESEEALRARLLEGKAVYDKALALVHCALEFGVRMVPVEPHVAVVDEPAETASSGRAYMQVLAGRARLKRHNLRRGEEIAAELRSVVGTRMVRERVEPLEPDAGLVSIAHLVKRPDFSAYRSAVQSVSARHPDVRFHLSGPWPPYSFAA